MEIKKCAICGSEPTLHTQHLGRNNGRGYQCKFDYIMQCEYCEMVKVYTTDIYDDGKVYTTDIYDDDGKDENANKKVIRMWNHKQNKIETHLLRKAKIIMNGEYGILPTEPKKQPETSFATEFASMMIDILEEIGIFGNETGIFGNDEEEIK